jgi:hypothetical protein
MSNEFDINDPDEIRRIREMLEREGNVSEEEVNRFFKQYNPNFHFEYYDFSSYQKDWQYADIKIVLGMHEKIQPFDIELDPEFNDDFKLWAKEMGWDK